MACHSARVWAAPAPPGLVPSGRSGCSVGAVSESAQARSESGRPSACRRLPGRQGPPLPREGASALLALKLLVALPVGVPAAVAMERAWGLVMAAHRACDLAVGSGRGGALQSLVHSQSPRLGCPPASSPGEDVWATAQQGQHRFPGVTRLRRSHGGGGVPDGAWRRENELAFNVFLCFFHTVYGLFHSAD